MTGLRSGFPHSLFCIQLLTDKLPFFLPVNLEPLSGFHHSVSEIISNV